MVIFTVVGSTFGQVFLGQQSAVKDWPIFPTPSAGRSGQGSSQVSQSHQATENLMKPLDWSAIAATGTGNVGDRTSIDLFLATKSMELQSAHGPMGPLGIAGSQPSHSSLSRWLRLPTEGQGWVDVQ